MSSARRLEPGLRLTVALLAGGLAGELASFTAPLSAQETAADTIADLAMRHAAAEQKYTDFTRVHPDSSRQSFMRCPGGPPTCRLAGDRPAVQALHPEVRSTSATVYVTTWEPTISQHRPIYRVTWRYELVRQGGRWVIARATMSSQT